MSKAKSSILLSGASLFGLGLNFLALPWLITWIGEGEWGVLIFLQTIMLYVGLIDLGFSSAAVKRLSEAFGRGDREAAWAVQRCQFAAHIVIGALGLALFWGLSFLVPFPKVSEPLLNKEWLFVLAGALFAVNAATTSISPIFVATERFATIAWRDSLQRIIGLSLGLWAAHTYGTLFAYLAATLVGSGLGFLLNFVTLKLSFADFRLRPGYSRAIFRDLMALGFRSYVHGIGSVMANSVHLPLMAYAGSASMPTRYQLAGRIPEALQAIVSPMSRTILPQLTREASSDQAAFARNVERYAMIGLGLGIVLILVPCAFGRELLAIWAKGNPALTSTSAIVLLLLGLYFTFELFFMMLTKAFYALGNPHFMAPFSLFNGLATLVFTVPVVLNFGLVGVAAQNLAIDAIQLVPMLLVVRKRAVPGLNVSAMLARVAGALAVGGSVAIGGYYIGSMPALVANPWLVLALIPLLSGATFLALVGLRLVPMPGDVDKLLARFRATRRRRGLRTSPVPEPVSKAP